MSTFIPKTGTNDPTVSNLSYLNPPIFRTESEAFPEFFSSCSVDQLAEYMERAQPSCLDKPSPTKIIPVGPRCGNALLEPGEECDCGTVEVKA